MKKIILMILIFSCTKIIKEFNFKNKDINEDLVLAVMNNDSDKAIELVKNGASVNYVHNNKSVLEWSLDKENLNIVKVLLEKEVELNKDNIIKIYDLSLEDFNYHVIDLIRDKFKLEEGLIDNNKYFLLLCYVSNVDKVKEFIEDNGINPADMRDKLNENALIISAASNNIDVFKMLVEEYNLDVNHKNNLGVTPLISASNLGNKDLIKFLLSKDANINDKNNKGLSALILASEKDYKEIVELLLEKGANVNDKDDNNWTALIFAVTNKNLEVVKLLLEKGANVNYKEDNGWTALMRAAQDGYKEIVELLLEKGANINEKEDDGWTALIFGANNNHLEVVELLLERGADINEKENDGRTALIFVAKIGYVELVRLLLEKGANINEKENDGWTALMRASQNDHKDIVKLLLEKGANINNKENNGRTVLMFTVLNGHEDIVKFLIERGANIYEKDNYNKTTIIHISDWLKSSKEKYKKDKYIGIAYKIIRKMSEDYVHLFISLNKDVKTNQEIKDEVHNYISLLYSLQNLPVELFEGIVEKF